MKVTMEHHIRVYDDSTGEYLEVCPDADGLGLLELRSCTKSGAIQSRVVFAPAMAPYLREALDTAENTLLVGERDE